MDKRLEGRIAVITGASSGLGKATAIRFANSGARVVCADLKSTGVENEIVSKHGKDSACFISCDVTAESDVEKLVEEAVKWGGRLDIMCNYAGIAIEGTNRCHEMATEIFDKTWSINGRGVFLCCKHAIKQMLEQEPRPPNARGERTRGWIVNAASILGKVAFTNTSAYTSSKHAVVGMTKVMGLDYAKDRIHINALAPGFTKSPMIDHLLENSQINATLEAKHPWGSLGTAEDIADAALFLASDEAAWITGHTLVVDGGYLTQ